MYELFLYKQILFKLLKMIHLLQPVLGVACCSGEWPEKGFGVWKVV
jgi:hypothetical protein